MRFKLFLLAVLMATAASLHAENGDLLPQDEKQIIDFHVHAAGLGYGNSGCFINERMRNNFRFKFYLMAMGVTEEELEIYGDRILFEKISAAVEESVSVSHAVILALDGVIDKAGDLDKEKTQVYVPSDYVFEQISRFENLLFAASINPYRADAISRLEKAHSQGAILIKWIPSIMNIDPADPAIRVFYEKMLELDLPLLTHTGMEKSFAGAKDELADPMRLELPLSIGLKVVAAHIATTGMSEGQDNFERILPMFEKYPNLYGDISSLTQINKLPYMEKALAAREVRGRLIYGSDWPLQFFPLVSPWYHLDQMSIGDAWSVGRLGNQWDRDVAMKRAMGVPQEVFDLGRDLFINPELIK